ncbi:MAG: trypsin-like peptidase domain-containing protein [bacterium]|nr:trypsin-like peptidase domain-containing protein [bacterium]
MPNCGYIIGQGRALICFLQDWGQMTLRAVLLSMLMMSMVPNTALRAEENTLFWTEQQSGLQNLPTLQLLNNELIELTDALLPAIVSLRVYSEEDNSNLPKGHPATPDNKQPYGTGSGFIIRSDGLVLTNHHVIEKGTTIEVHFYNGDVATATILGEDPIGDLALLQIKTKHPLPVVPLGNSSALKVGEFVVAIGSPFGFKHTITFGIVSAKKRPLLRSGVVGGFIQTDASINTGNSGGPLVNMSGEVVGVNTATVGSGELGFAIPIDAVKSILPQLYHKGAPARGWLGVQIRPLELDQAKVLGLENSSGVYVHDVLNDQPAQQAGIKVGDVILRFDGRAITSPFDLQSVVSATPTGKTVEVSLLRKQTLYTVELTVGIMPGK